MSWQLERWQTVPELVVEVSAALAVSLASLVGSVVSSLSQAIRWITVAVVFWLM